jgi:hypothetical protein
VFGRQMKRAYDLTQTKKDFLFKQHFFYFFHFLSKMVPFRALFWERTQVTKQFGRLFPIRRIACTGRRR